jgi:hypothetical protein
MNIIRLRIGQVSKLWDSIRLGIIEAIYPAANPDSEVLQEVLCRLQKDEMQCWCIYDEEEKVHGYVVTSIETSMCKKVLLVYSLYLFNNLSSKEDYIDICDNIEKFAKGNGCHRVIAYSMNPTAISMAEKMGYSSDQRVLIKEV